MHLSHRCSTPNGPTAGTRSRAEPLAPREVSRGFAWDKIFRLLIPTAAILLTAAKPQPSQPTSELIGSDLHVTVPMKSLAPTISDAEFEQALETNKAAAESKARMAAVLAEESRTYAALKLRGQAQVDALDRAAREGEAVAAELLADMLDTGDHLKEDPARAFGYYRAAALGGRMEAAHSLGVSYSKGRGTPRDFSEALAWFIVARQRGDTSGVDDTLRVYLQQHRHEGLIARAQRRAEELQGPLKREAVVASLPPASPLEFDSSTTETTDSVDKPPVSTRDDALTNPPVVVITILGKRWTWPSLQELQQAASRGDRTALAALGRLLVSGKSISPDPMRAVVLLERAAAMGEVDAAHQLGDLYSQGDGIVRDDAKAFSFFLQAAQGRSPLAMANVGVYYTNGRGTKADLVQGLAWLSTAKSYRVDLGQEKRLRDFLQKNHPDDVHKADALAVKIRSEIEARLSSGK